MQIVPIRDLRDTTAISERCKQSQEPIFITKNGYGDMVVMSMETYERSIAMAEVYRKL
ncbi:MAG: type II toxin-antitoxin system Phd/YefM family antitoxin, partial [Clostridia bacterium]